MLQCTMAHRSRPHDQSAVRHGLGDGFKFFRLLQQVRRADRRTSFAKPRRIGIHKAQPVCPKIAQGSSRCANVQRIARAHQHHDETV
jgi:hypothetical protein